MGDGIILDTLPMYTSPGIPIRRGRLSTVDLPVGTSFKPLQELNSLIPCSVKINQLPVSATRGPANVIKTHVQNLQVFVIR
jgi:hypothetical protein